MNRTQAQTRNEDSGNAGEEWRANDREDLLSDPAEFQDVQEDMDNDEMDLLEEFENEPGDVDPDQMDLSDDLEDIRQDEAEFEEEGGL